MVSGSVAPLDSDNHNYLRVKINHDYGDIQETSPGSV